MRTEESMGMALYTMWLFCVSFSLAGVQFVYSGQFAIGGPLFSNKFKLSDSIVNIIMSTAGPISGFFVQPIIGVISDSYTSRFGRRRPFIFVGTVFTAVGMAIIATSVNIGDALGDVDNGILPSQHTISIAFAIAGLWIMNLFTNVIQGPARALVNDVVSSDRLQLANATVAGIMSFSAVAANLIGAQFLTSPNPYFVIFLMGTGFVLFSMLPTLIFAKEKVHEPTVSDLNKGISDVFKEIFYAFKSMPRSMLKVVLVYFLSWCAYTPLMINQTKLFQTNIYHHESYGLMIGMYSLALFATLSFQFSLVLPYCIKIIGSKATYVVTQLIATASYACICFLVPLSPWIALLLTSITAWNFTAFNSIPFAITTEIVGTEKCGLYMGVLNSASVIAQTVAGSLSKPVLDAAQNDLRWAIGLGGIFSILAVISALFLETVPLVEKQLQDISEEREPMLN